jgi:voltage-gated potassium channel
MYFAENEAQPDKFPDIPSTMWWSVVTLTTVGYGDVYPVTSLGKLFAAIISITGIGMFALPTGILGANFVQEIQRQKFNQRVCPHCGKEIE